MSTALPESLAEQIIGEKIREWEAKRKQKDTKIIHPFLTISRDFGCREEEILPQLEQRLGWKIYGRNMLDVLSKNDYLSRGMMESLDEQKQDSVQNWITYLLHTGAILQKDYVLKISQMMRIVAAHESAIFLGRGANFIFRGVKEGLRVYLTAPFAARLQNMAASKNLSLAAAEKLVHDKDRERNEFFNHYFGQELQSGDAYDVALNTATLSTATICKTIGNLLPERSAP